MHYVALVAIPEEFINGIETMSLKAWLSEALEYYDYNATAHFEEMIESCCDDANCPECAGTGEYTSSCNPDGCFDWYEFGGRWSNLLYSFDENVPDFAKVTTDNPWLFVVSAQDAVRKMRSYLTAIQVFELDGLQEKLLSEDNVLTAAYYVVIDYHS